MPLMVTDLYRYPVKSCRGERLPAVPVEPWGLAGDRRWMIVDPGGEVVTARERPRLLLVTPHVADGFLRLTGPAMPDLTVLIPDGDELIPVIVWKSKLLAAPASAEADAWFSDVVGEPVRLVYLDDPTRRRLDPGYSREQDRVSFADGYPLLLAARESLGDLNERIAASPRAAAGPLPMRRFRPNVVVAGAAAWAEDGWRLLQIGEMTFRCVKGCDRCVMTTVDPDTAAKGKEPITTLAQFRRWDGAVWFGVNLIPDSAGSGSAIRVGDPVSVLDQADGADGPLR